MPLTDKGQKIMANMQREYGPKKGESVFYASRNAGRITGVDPGHARGGIVEHDLDPDLPRRQEDAALVPIAYPPAYLETIHQLQQNRRQPPTSPPQGPPPRLQAGLGETRGFAAGGDTGAKRTQQEVNYRRSAATAAVDQCGKCAMYRKTGGGIWGSCTKVEGRITPYGTCDIVDALISPFGKLPHHERVAYLHARL